MGADLSDGFILANGKAIELEETLSGDHTSTGFVITGAIAGEGLSFPALCYLKSDGKYWKTDANAIETTTGPLLIALEVITAGNAGKFLKRGYIRNDTWSFSVADVLYVGDTAGVISNILLSAVGDCVRKIGYAYGSSIVVFEPSETIIEI